MSQAALVKSSPKSNKILFEDFLSFSGQFFKFVTFKFSSFSKKKTSNENSKILLSDLFFWFSAFNVCLFVSLCAVSALKKSFDIAAFTFSMPLLTSTSLVIVKCLTVYCNKENISEVLDIMKIAFPKETLMQKKYNIKRYYKSYKLFAQVYAFLFMVPCFCVMALPLIELVRSGEKSFPLHMWLPFDSQRNEVYAVSLCWSVWACVNSVLILIAVDTLMFVLITLLSMEFDILTLDFKNMINTETPSIHKTAVELIQRHNNLIECSLKLERIFSPSFLYNFVQSSFVICLTAFQYTTSTEASQILFNGSYCIAILNQIWLLCYFGQKVIDSSENIASGAYNSEWEKIESLKLRKAIMIVIERAQTPSKLTAMNFTDISLKSFTTVKLS